MLPLERAMSGVFHRVPSQSGMHLVPSRMSMQERREYHKSHNNPEWVLKSVSKKGTNPLTEFFTTGIKAFGMALGGKALLGIVFGLLGRRKKVLDVIKEAFEMDTFRFAGFFGLYIGILRAVNAHLYNVRGKNDRWNAVIAGLISSATLLIDNKERRQLVAIYVFVRAMSVLVKGLSRERIIPYYEHAEAIIFGVVNMPIMYGFLLEPEILDPGYYKWILGMGNQTHDALHITLRARPNHFAKTGELLPFCTCQPHYHTGSCVGYCVHDWFLGLGRASKIYAPVHILPMLIFRYKKLLEDPKSQLTETTKALVYSCMFLTTYQFNVKFSQCMLRNFRQVDDPYNAMFGGLLTGLACLFERPSRVSELMLYCVPKAFEACWNYGATHWGFRPIPYFELPLFAVGSAILLSALKEDLKSTYFNALSFVVTGQFQKSSSSKKKKGDKSEEETDE